MKLEEFKKQLNKLESLHFTLENGQSVPSHFHITEVGQISKHFIDCGGKVREEKKINFQLWVAEDITHRLKPSKLLQIIQESEEKLGLGNEEIQVEYQNGESIGLYHLEYKDEGFVLTNTQTACLALDACGIAEKTKVVMSNLGSESNCCDPNSGCC